VRIRAVTSNRRSETPAGLIAALAALLTAVVGVCAFLYQVLDKKDDNAKGPPTGAEQTTGPPADESRAAAVPVAGSGPHEIVLTGSGIDFDVIPPRAFTRFDNAVDAYGGDMLITYPKGAGIAKWTGAAPPSRQECVNAINSAPMNSAAVTGGSRFCLVTQNELHYAYLEFTEPAENGFRLRATIWQGN